MDIGQQLIFLSTTLLWMVMLLESYWISHHTCKSDPGLWWCYLCRSWGGPGGWGSSWTGMSQISSLLYEITSTVQALSSPWWRRWCCMEPRSRSGHSSWSPHRTRAGAGSGTGDPWSADNSQNALINYALISNDVFIMRFYVINVYPKLNTSYYAFTMWTNVRLYWTPRNFNKNAHCV